MKSKVITNTPPATKKITTVKKASAQARINAEELFSLFTADIINKKITFTR